jgi:hypothetical protein
VWCDGEPRYLDEIAARHAAALLPDGRERMGLDGPIPRQFPGHRIAPHVECREFPLRYLTSDIRRLVRLWRLHSAGHRLRDDGVLHWPARLVEALDLLTRERALRERHAD